MVVCLVHLVCFVYLVDLVHLVSFVQPNKRDKPKKPNNGFLLLDSDVDDVGHAQVDDLRRS